MGSGTAKCKCCGGGIYYRTDRTSIPPERCGSCEVRDGLCLHNISEHLPYYHSSRNHAWGCWPQCKLPTPSPSTLSPEQVAYETSM